MAAQHASAGEQIDVKPLGNGIPNAKTSVLFKAEDLEVLRLVLPTGKTIAEHKAPGEITVQCIEGRVLFKAMNKTTELTAGTMLFLPRSEPHALQAVEDSSLLVTIVLSKAAV